MWPFVLISESSGRPWKMSAGIPYEIPCSSLVRVQSLDVAGCRGEERLAAQLESGRDDTAARRHVDDQRKDLAHLLGAGDCGVGTVDVLGESMVQRLVVDDHAFGRGGDARDLTRERRAYMASRPLDDRLTVEQQEDGQVRSAVAHHHRLRYEAGLLDLELPARRRDLLTPGRHQGGAEQAVDRESPLAVERSEVAGPEEPVEPDILHRIEVTVS